MALYKFAYYYYYYYYCATTAAILKLHTHYSAADGPIWAKFRNLIQNSTQITPIWSKSQSKKNSNMADVCFSKPEVVVFQPWIEP